MFWHFCLLKSASEIKVINILKIEMFLFTLTAVKILFLHEIHLQLHKFARIRTDGLLTDTLRNSVSAKGFCE